MEIQTRRNDTIPSDTNPCHICTESLLNFDDEPNSAESKRRMKLLFHGTCSNEDNSDQQSLCAFCHHLRLGHLLGCLKDGKLKCRIRFCAFEDIEKRQSCPFCHLLIQSTMPYSFFSRMTPPYLFASGYVEMIVEAGCSVFMKFQYPGGSWMGARRIYYDSGLKAKCTGYRELVDQQLIEEEVVQRRREFGTNREPITFQTIKRIGGSVDWDIMSDWLSSCSDEHPKCGPRDLGVKPAHFRLIDVRRRRIVSAPHDCRYVALSYVWGLEPDRSKMSTQATLESLQKDGGLLVSNVVKTINDAITICSQLKEDFLWVDQYCIIQDDIDDQAEQIASMSAIYSSAAFVIISTDGDMNDGIPGVSSERAQKQIQCELAGMKFINELPSWREITGGSSIWSTRGWTYQEGILGRRKMYFSSSQSFFECDKSILDEDGMKQDAMYSPNGLYPQRWHPVVDTFYGHVAKYSRRHLGSEFDIYNAIEGIASALYASKHPLWFGLPRVDFDKALLWCHDSPSNREFEGAVKSPPEGLIPSWSWSSTTQSVLLLDDGNRRLIRYCGPLVMWNSCQKTETGCKVEEIVPSSAVDFQCPHCESDVTGNNRDGRYTDEQLLHIAVAWSQGCIECKYPFKRLHKTSISSLKQSITSHWSCMHRNWHFQDLNRAFIGAFLSMPKLEPTVIFTRAQSAFFRLNLPTDQSNFLRDYPIINDSETVGVLIGQDPDIQKNLHPQVEAGEHLEFIGLSISRLDGIILPDATTEYGNFLYGDPREKLRQNESLRDLTYLDKKGKTLLPIPVVNVMLIRRTEWTARRVSVGWIYLKKWVQAKPKFGVIFLE